LLDQPLTRSSAKPARDPAWRLTEH